MNKLLTSALSLLIVMLVLDTPLTLSSATPNSSMGTLTESTSLARKKRDKTDTEQVKKERPILFSVKADFRTKYISADGSYATNGSHREVDLGINYTWKWFALGISPNRSMYNHYNRDFCFANVVLGYETGIPFKNFYLPLNAQLVFNPYIQKPAFVLSVVLDSKNYKKSCD